VTEPVVQVTDLVKRYGELEAVRGISFEVEPGETFGFLGPNGAGKSTTIKILCTLTDPTSGSARVAGYDVKTQRDTVRRNIGLVFQDTTLDSYLTGEQNLRFHADLYGVPRSQVDARMKMVLDMVNLWDRRRSVVGTYSGGMKRRLEIARGLLHAPRVLFLDEPTVGLDPQTRSSIWEYINDLKQREDITIFLTTHYMDEAEHCDRIGIIDHGQIVAIDTPENLKASIGKDRIQISTANDAEAIKELKQRFDLDGAVHENLVTFKVASGEQFVPRLFAELSVPIRSVSVARPSLDDVFMSYTGRTIRDTEATASDKNRAHMMAFGRGRLRANGAFHHPGGHWHRPGQRLGHRGHQGRHPGQRPAAGPAGDQHRLAQGDHQVQERPAPGGHLADPAGAVPVRPRHRAVLFG
jgi:ABC-2 type transport system ATP-binding protein